MWPYKKTTKLFFNRYVNKVSIRTPYAACFRGKNLDRVKDEIVYVIGKFDSKENRERVQIGNTWNKKYASLKDTTVASDIVAILETLEDYILRIEGNTLNVYFNIENGADIIKSIANIDIEEICQPENQKIKDYLLQNPRKIIRKEYSHKFKVTVNSLWDDADRFTEWAEKLPKIKCASKKYKFGGHFYVADEKTLSLCRIFLGDKIRKVEELVKDHEF